MLKTLTLNAITQYIDDNLESISIDINALVDYSDTADGICNYCLKKT